MMKMDMSQQVSSEVCMDDESLAVLRKQTTTEVIPQAHGAAVVSYNLQGNNPLKWTVTVRVFEQITQLPPPESFVEGNNTQH